MSQDSFDGSSTMFGPDLLFGQGSDSAPDSGQNFYGQQSGSDFDQLGPPQSPDGYDLIFDQNTQLDQDMLRDFKQVAFDRGMDPATAQALATLYEDRARIQMDGLRQQKEAWEAEARQSPEFGKDLAAARRALALCPPDQAASLKQILHESMLGSHPAMIRFLGAVGRRLGEPAFRGNSAAGYSDPAKILYPNHN